MREEHQMDKNTQQLENIASGSPYIGSIRVSSDIHSALFGTMAYTVILCFSLLKTGSLSKQIFGSH